MRVIGLIFGVIVDLLGLLWLLQGLNVIGGSRMTGEPFWAIMGVVLMFVGTLVIVMMIRRSPTRDAT